MAIKLLEPIPPGEVLSEEFMKPLELSINALARELDVPPNRISEIVGGKRAITADTNCVSTTRTARGGLFIGSIETR